MGKAGLSTIPSDFVLRGLWGGVCFRGGRGSRLRESTAGIRGHDMRFLGQKRRRKMVTPVTRTHKCLWCRRSLAELLPNCRLSTRNPGARMDRSIHLSELVISPVQIISGLALRSVKAMPCRPKRGPRRGLVRESAA